MDADDKFGIKTLLFSKSIPNYDIPTPVDGHRIYSCVDCGDKFIFESSYTDHINRKAVQITYACRHCSQTKVFFNRCKLLLHIRSHNYKTTTINVNDLKVEPLPLRFFNVKPINTQNLSPQVIDISKKSSQRNICYECKQVLTPSTGTAYKDRASHFMQYTNEAHTCPVCLFALPTICGLRAHLRFHLNCAPYFCPECGIHLPNKNIQYPYNHDCEGFNMMRATARLKCPVPKCHLFHPNDFKEHMKENHLKKVYKCPFCVVACFMEATMNKHLKTHKTVSKATIFYQCELCPGKLVVQNNMNSHLRTHVNVAIFPCWTCGCTFKEVKTLVEHSLVHLSKQPADTCNSVQVAVKGILEMINKSNSNSKRIYRVVKRCDQCKRNFTYKCIYNEISVLPNECPFKCTTKLQSDVTTVDTENTIICALCKEKISPNWEDVKKHYAKNHKMHKCLEPKLSITKLDLAQYYKKKKITAATTKVTSRKRKPNTKPKVNEQEIAKPVSTKEPGTYCTICDYTCENKQQLENHFLRHKDPCMAYQCMECGESFIVKPSFSTHLMLEHNISNAEEYINNKKCYNENALEKHQNSDTSYEPLKDNQCRICREQFDNSEDLAKHFRVHGMAFLLKSSSKKSVS